jgi:hypothetical protein
MKHIKEYSKYRASLNENLNTFEDLVFDWIPYDEEKENPINNSIKKQLNFIDLKSFIAENSSIIKNIQNAGIFMAHVPDSSGFNRYIVTSMNPILLEMSRFDKDFNLLQKHSSISPEEVDLGKLSKGSKLLGKFKS